MRSCVQLMRSRSALTSNEFAMLDNVHIALQFVKAKRTTFLCNSHRMDYDDRPESAKRLEKARQNRGFKTAKEAAIYHGWSPDTYIQHENGTRGISRSADRYAKAFRVKEAWLMGYDDDDSSDSPVDEDGLEVAGTIEAGNFRDISLEDQDTERPKIPLQRNVRFAHADQYALRVSGDSMNEMFPDGSYVACVEFTGSGLTLSNGMVLHVERMIAGTQLVESTLKLVEFVDGKVKLAPRSTNPRHKPFFLDGGEDTEVIVRGVVFGMWMPQQI